MLGAIGEKWEGVPGWEMNSVGEKISGQFLTEAKLEHER